MYVFESSVVCAYQVLKYNSKKLKAAKNLGKVSGKVGSWCSEILNCFAVAEFEV